jgi:hypothetical protein
LSGFTLTPTAKPATEVNAVMSEFETDAKSLPSDKLYSKAEPRKPTINK